MGPSYLIRKKKLPPYGSIYGLTPIKVEALQKEVDKNLGQGFIQLSTSSARALILFVKKKDRRLCLCVDYGELNWITIKNHYALPLIGKLIDRLRDAQHFMKIDLWGAYNLVCIAPGEEWKIAFRCWCGHFEYKIMPFGLTNAPTSFQALINDIPRPCLDRFAWAYLDDIVIYSTTLKEHRLHVRKVLRQLQACRIFVQKKKCKFHRELIEFLGFVIGRGFIQMDLQKVNSVASWLILTHLKLLQAFLKFANFYWQFI